MGEFRKMGLRPRESDEFRVKPDRRAVQDSCMKEGKDGGY